MVFKAFIVVSCLVNTEAIRSFTLPVCPTLYLVLFTHYSPDTCDHFSPVANLVAFSTIPLYLLSSFTPIHFVALDVLFISISILIIFASLYYTEYRKPSAQRVNQLRQHCDPHPFRLSAFSYNSQHVYRVSRSREKSV